MSVMPGTVGRLDELRGACTLYRGLARQRIKQHNLDLVEQQCRKQEQKLKQKQKQRGWSRQGGAQGGETDNRVTSPEALPPLLGPLLADQDSGQEEDQHDHDPSRIVIRFKSERLLQGNAGVDELLALALDLTRIDAAAATSTSGRPSRTQRHCNGNAEVEPQARLLEAMLRRAAARVDWSLYHLMAKTWLPALAAMSKPRTSAFGVLFTAGKILTRSLTWPDPDASRSALAAEVVKREFMDGSDLMTAAWLLASLRLEEHFSFEELYTAVRANMQGFRSFCLLTSKHELQRQMLSRFIDEALNCKSLSDRRQGLRAAANIIAAAKMDRELFPAVCHQKAIDWLCYLVRKVPWWVAEDYALAHRDFLVLCVEQLTNDKRLPEAAMFLRRHYDEIKGHVEDRLCEKLMAVDVNSLEKQLHLETFGPHLAEALELGLPQSAVTLVDTEAAATVALQKISSADLVGVDMEWGSLGDWLEGRLALLQVALPEQVFLIDLLSLAANNFAMDIFRALLSSARPLVVGFSFHNDLHELRKSPWRETANSILGLCDLQTMSDAKDDNGQVRGLAWLVEKTLKRKFCKAEQRSCWLRRPLRPGQLHYAALDAFVLLQLSAALLGLPMPSHSNSHESEVLTRSLEDMVVG
mmetsp:Transcript_84957/g.177563  ORF Transcript_84957/g.177563 Transcript_84957/m.177563 type:complete len:640 (-) Transcript_84957:30-1949(-)